MDDNRNPQPNVVNDGPGKTVTIIAVILALLIGAPLFVKAILPGIMLPSASHRRTQSLHNLKQIGLALHNYHQEYGSFPPAYIADSEGRPMHSWRVLILPYLDQKSLYDQYRFDEPWDGPHNRALYALRPTVYSDPSSKDETKSHTNYAVITGAKTMFPGAKPVAIRKVRDGISTVLAVVSIGDSEIVWSEPRDLQFDSMSFQINDHEHPSISCEGLDDVPVLYGDCSVRTLEKDELTAEALKSSILRSDGK